MVVSTVTRKGKCEVCEVEAVLYCGTGNIWMCKEHKAEDDALTTANAKAVVVASRRVDSEIVLKADLFNAATVSFMELQAAIDHDSTIAPEKKNLSLMTEVAARIDKLNQVIFAEEAALVAKKNERHALLVNAQNVAAKLHAAEREKFKQYDITYQPAKPKTVKSPAVPKKKAFDKTAVFEAAKKYNVPAAQVQSLILAKNLSPEDAAKHMAQLMGLI